MLAYVGLTKVELKSASSMCSITQFMAASTPENKTSVNDEHQQQ
jgi:hypothetical protein